MILQQTVLDEKSVLDEIGATKRFGAQLAINKNQEQGILYGFKYSAKKSYRGRGGGGL